MTSVATKPIRRASILRTLALLPLLLVGLVSVSPGATPQVGQPFPDFSGKTIDGKEVKLADYKGKVVLLDFWATWCGPCLRELPSVKAAYGQYHPQGFEIIGISLDSDDAKLKAFLAEPKTTLAWPSIYDGGGWQSELAKRFGIQSIPATFLLDKEGVVRATNLRGAAVASKVARMLDPTLPPSLDELVPKYLAASEADAPALAESLRKSNSSAGEGELSMSVAAFVNTGAKMPADRAALLAELFGPLETVGEDNFKQADLKAMCLDAAGDSKGAAALEEQVVTTIGKLIEENVPAEQQQSQRNSTGYTMPMVKAALYHAKAGNTARAKELLATVDAVPNPRSKEFFAKHPYYIEARKLAPADAAAPAEDAKANAPS